MRTPLHVLHSVNGGYVDTLGFVTMHGLFAAHVTGNIITMAAGFVTEMPQTVGKLLALPVYCAAVLLTRAMTYRLSQRSPALHLRVLLALNASLLTVAAILAIHHGPFTDADAPAAVLTGMVMVAGMSIQNVVRRLHLPSAPPTTVMTGVITQLMMDLVDALYQRRAGQAAAVLRRGLPLSRGLAGFAAGAAMAAVSVTTAGPWAFALPPAIAAAAALSCLAEEKTT